MRFAAETVAVEMQADVRIALDRAELRRLRPAVDQDAVAAVPEEPDGNRLRCARPVDGREPRQLLLVQPSLGALLSADQDQSDMQSATAIIIVILILGILVHTLFSLADRSIRRRWGLTASN